MTTIDWLALLLGIACVVLGVLRSVGTFPTGIASVVLVGIVAFRSRLYSDAILQAVFVAANLYGWLNWTSSRKRSGDVVVGWMSPAALRAWLAVWVVGSIAWAVPMAAFTDAARPWWDAPTAVASIVAQILMAQRRLENWLVWIAVDVALIPLYLLQHLQGLAFLYVIYLALSAWGFADWLRTARRAARGAAAA